MIFNAGHCVTLKVMTFDPPEKVFVDCTEEQDALVAIPVSVKNHLDRLVEQHGRGILKTIADRATAAGRVQYLEGGRGTIPMAFIQPEDLLANK
ncbi:hypothetical protein HYZ99_05795 [Candidatus Peregrinibacteria bacterium]|nr:hypothetical protein [Candidatus Peregrinibacteria bacterium]